MRCSPLRLVSAALVIALMAVTTRVSVAESTSSLVQRVTSSPDFRIRSFAALKLGRSPAPVARPTLERALSDVHPAVRAAAATALSALGDAAAIASLERAASVEPMADVRARMRQSIGELSEARSSSSVDHASYVLQLGDMRNGSGVENQALGSVLRSAAHDRASKLSGAAVLDSPDAKVLRRAAQRKIPVLVLDGNINRLSQTSSTSSITVAAHVEFSVRRFPEQTLKGTIAGRAVASDAAAAARNNRRVAELQSRAVGGAVDSALSSMSASGVRSFAQ